MKKSIIRQTLIFFCYLIISSSVLFTHKGGEDIFFLLLMLCFGVIHIFFSMYKYILSKENKYDFISCITLIIIFILLNNSYLKFMWCFTNLFK